MKQLIPSILFFFTSLCGQEFIVNTFTNGHQRDPNTAWNTSGEFAVVWKSDSPDSGRYSDIRIQFFQENLSSVGEEIIVNTQDGSHESPRVAMNDENYSVVIWAALEDDFNIKGRLFNQGTPVGEEFSINTTTVYSQTNPDVAMWPSGEFMVVWESWYQDGSDRGIYGRKFYADGTPGTNEFLINTATEYSQAKPAVAILPDESFVVNWESWNQDQDHGYGVFAQLFSNICETIGSEFQVNTIIQNDQWFTDVAALPDSGFISVWCSWEQDGSDGGIYSQRFNQYGEKVGDENQVNSTTSYYQWLPKVTALEDNGYAIIWSSWKQDGNREGVYIKFYDINGGYRSFEMRVNEEIQDFQWEPANPVPRTDGSVLTIWSSHEQFATGYNIVGNIIAPVGAQATVNPNSYDHTSGISTTMLRVHVLDTLALTGDNYELTFTQEENIFLAHIANLTSGTTPVSGFSIDQGEGTFYLTPQFEGIAVEIIPEMDLALNIDGSYLSSQSGTNLVMELTAPGAGTPLVAPIDIVLDWNSTATDSTGNFIFPADTAINSSGSPAIVTPFHAWNITDDSPVIMLIPETVAQNGQWDPEERIIFLTPPPYQEQGSNTHAQIITSLPANDLIMPGENDAFYIITYRPLTTTDIYRFSTSSEFILSVGNDNGTLDYFRLGNNYPNPFNAITLIPYTITRPGKVTITILDIIGREILQLVNTHHNVGKYFLNWDGMNRFKQQVGSGIYFYRIQAGRVNKTRKMLLIK